MKSNVTLYRHADLYFGKSGPHYFVFNPLSAKGVLILTDELHFILTALADKSTANDLYSRVFQKYPHILPTRFQHLIGLLAQSELIHFGTSDLISRIRNRKQTAFEVWFHLTNQCNLHCSYCFVAKSNEHMSNETVAKSIEQIFSSAKNHQFEKVSIRLSGGEPLLQMKQVLAASEFVDVYSKKNKIQAKKEIITNGVLLTEKAADLFKQHNIHVTVSFDGVREGQDQNRPFANAVKSYDYVTAGLKNALNAHILERVIVTITNHNVKQLPDITKRFLKERIPFSYQFFVSNPNVDPKVAACLQVEDDVLISYLRKSIRVAYQYLPDYPIANSLIHTLHIGAPSDTCGAADRTFLTVRQDGHLANCNWAMDKSIGTIHDGDVIDTYRKNAYIKPVRSLPKKVSCHTCRWRFICSGCPLEFKWNKDAYSPPYCKVKMTLIPEVLQLEAARIIKYKINNSKK